MFSFIKLDFYFLVISSLIYIYSRDMISYRKINSCWIKDSEWARGTEKDVEHSTRITTFKLFTCHSSLRPSSASAISASAINQSSLSESSKQQIYPRKKQFTLTQTHIEWKIKVKKTLRKNVKPNLNNK